MSQETQQFTELLKQVGTTAKLLGVDKLTEILKDVQKNHKDITMEQYNISHQVIQNVCKVYEITEADFFDNKRKNMRKYALATVCYILNKNYNFDYYTISFIVKKSKSLVSVLITEISQLDNTHFQDRIIVKKLQQSLTLIQQ